LILHFFPSSTPVSLIGKTRPVKPDFLAFTPTSCDLLGLLSKAETFPSPLLPSCVFFVTGEIPNLGWTLLIVRFGSPFFRVRESFRGCRFHFDFFFSFLAVAVPFLRFDSTRRGYGFVRDFDSLRRLLGLPFPPPQCPFAHRMNRPSPFRRLFPLRKRRGASSNARLIGFPARSCIQICFVLLLHVYCVGRIFLFIFGGPLISTPPRFLLASAETSLFFFFVFSPVPLRSRLVFGISYYLAGASLRIFPPCVARWMR